MRFNRFSLILVSTLILSSCASTSTSSSNIPEIPIETNVLSGREGSNGPVLVVKVDDTNMAHPQIGVEDADVVYIEQVEGGLTRLAAVFSSKIPVEIGPVRSARISDIEILSQYGRVAFAYSGAQKKLLPVIAEANLQNLGAQTQSSLIYTRDSTRVSPYSLVLRADLLMAKIVEKQYDVVQAQSVGWKFGNAPIGGVDVTSVSFRWPATGYQANWSQSEKCWKLIHNSQPNVVQSGKQLCPSTVILQKVSITNSEYHDKLGNYTPFSNTVGTGPGYILRDGKSFAGTWTRENMESGTTWTSSDGQEILMSPGQVWVALLQNDPEFITASASPSPTK